MSRSSRNDAWLTLMIIHAAMMATPILYGVIAYFIAEQAPPAAPAANRDLLVGILAGLAAITGIASFVVRALLMPLRARVSDGRPIDASVLGTAPAQAALARVRIALIASWALCEATAVFGLIAGFLFRDASLYAPFGAAAIALLLVHAPRPGVLIAVMTALPR
jgi:F0F1-type ATP synthase membrane subunit c/vacuolar-type H+-ATPase subunit K